LLFIAGIIPLCLLIVNISPTRKPRKGTLIHPRHEWTGLVFAVICKNFLGQIKFSAYPG
jgi:hypothetical protein